MSFRILRIDPEGKRIGLSARAAKHDEPVADARAYSSEVGSGMASLGELADLVSEATRMTTATAEHLHALSYYCAVRRRMLFIYKRFASHRFLHPAQILMLKRF